MLAHDAEEGVRLSWRSASRFGRAFKVPGLRWHSRFPASLTRELFPVSASHTPIGDEKCCTMPNGGQGRNRKSRFLRDLVRATSADGSQCRLLEKGPTTPAHDAI